MSADPADDPFFELLTELSDGARWKLTRAETWDQFVEALSDTIVRLAPRRRQAVMMLLLALTENLVTPDQVREHLEAHPADSPQGVEQLIAWLRGFRPR